MNLLDLDQLFYTCPYPVKYDGDEYTFRTDHDIVYAVDFKEELSLTIKSGCLSAENTYTRFLQIRLTR